MSLQTSSVHKNLDTEIKIAGLDAQDLLLILMVAMVMNVLFGNTPMAEVLVFGLPVLLSIVLFFGKRGKPKNFLIDYARFITREGHYSAGLLTKEKGEPFEKLK